MTQPNTRKDSIDKSEQIFQGAIGEFLEKGYAGTSMDKVAAAAGVSKATVYSYFQDKEGLFKALVARMARERFYLVFGTESLQGEPEVVLRRLATKLLDRIARDREYLAFVRLVIGESGRFPDLAQELIRNIVHPGIKELSGYFASHPELKIADSEAVARIVIGGLVYFVLTQEVLQGKEIMPMERDRLIDSLVVLLIG
ncbi:TetR/AcrR family transcriptional regulator [Lusitaniella coriacea]|uniref:TetR/AcrR family transcriptional regulator n=1 Tax=Lusitaniella coriacea TaxID=1983105 RepID=UPI003CE903D8